MTVDDTRRRGKSAGENISRRAAATYHQTKNSNADEWDEVASEYIKGERSDNSTSIQTAEAKLIEEFASKINTSISRSVQEILKRGNCCLEAKGRLSAEGTKELLKKLECGPSDFSKYVRIGSDRRLPKIAKWLPPSFSSIYLISALSDERLKAGTKTEIISPKATREDIQKYCQEAAEADKPRAPVRASGKNRNKTTPAQSNELEDDQFFNFDEEDSTPDSETSEETTVYDELLNKWKKKGLLRSDWLRTSSAVRDKIQKDLRKEPFEPTA